MAWARPAPILQPDFICHLHSGLTNEIVFTDARHAATIPPTGGAFFKRHPMTKTLIIAEKPSVAADIANAIGNCTKTADGFERADVVISAAAGHLATVIAPGADKSGKSLETLPVIPEQFEVRPIDDPRALTRFKMLQRLMSRPDVTAVVNACDAGREGELIFRLIYEAAGCRKACKRMWLKSMTSDAIREAFANMAPAAEYDRLADAARCRSEADWLVGINGSRGVSILHQIIRGVYQSTPTGRVQTPTLAILVDLEEKIRNFKPVDYFEVHGTFGAAAGDYTGRWYNANPIAGPGEDGEGSKYRITKREDAEAILAKCRGAAPSSVRDETKPSTETAPRLFDLTTLQREANKKFKLSAADTLKIAQSLYERHKVTTYPRTDATALPEDYVEPAKQILADMSGTKYEAHAQRALRSEWVRPTKRIFDNAKISDHFAIIPTGLKPQGLTEAEEAIYDMITRRFIAAFYPAAEYLETLRITTVVGEQFRSSGRVMQLEGWKAVYGALIDNDDKTPALPPVSPSERVVTKAVELKALKTKPPKRMTEAMLLSAMEHAGRLVDDSELSEAMAGRGLGTPATRAATIEGLLSTAGSGGKTKEPYLVRDKNYLVPTEKGINLISFLRQIGVGALTSPAMTGEWEYKLQLMSEGKYERTAFMHEIEQATRDMLDAIRGKAPAVDAVTLGVPCPKCGGAVKGGISSYACEHQCGLEVRRQLLSRALAPSEVAQLLEKRLTDKLDGFVSTKSNKPFSAMLKLTNEWKVEFEFPPREDADPAVLAAAPALKHVCPKCKGTMRALETKFVCEKGDFYFNRTISGRSMIDVEADYLIEKKKTPVCGGFLSTRTGKGFSAGYKLTRDHKVELFFD